MARRVSREEGLLIGGSCGTAVAAGLVVARESTKDDLVVVLIPDSGRGYLSKVFNDEWMASFGFLESEGPVIRDVLAARGSDVPDLVYVQPETTTRDAFEMMHQHGVSQLPVAKGEMPLSAAEVMGAIDELQIMQRSFNDSSVMAEPVEKVMGPRLPTIGVGQPIALAVEMLDAGRALLVLDGGRPRGVISRTDVLTFLSN